MDRFNSSNPNVATSPHWTWVKKIEDLKLQNAQLKADWNAEIALNRSLREHNEKLSKRLRLKQNEAFGWGLLAGGSLSVFLVTLVEVFWR